MTLPIQESGERTRILIADDEETFRRSTADLLRREGFDCDIAADGGEASEKLAHSPFDLLITDVRMPGNSGLELLQGRWAGEGMPVIVVTAYPSIESAIASIQHRVVSYLLKPVEFPELVDAVKSAVERGRIDRVFRRHANRLSVLHDAARKAEPTPDAFMGALMGNIADCLSDLRHLWEAQRPASASGAAKPEGPQYTCKSMNCPRGLAMVQAIQHTIATLEATKASFKSKELGNLRRHLEGVLEQYGTKS